MTEIASLVSLLTALTQPDTNTIRQAEAALKPILKNPACMNPLWQIIADTNQPIAVRHVGAIILRKRLVAHYSTSFDDATKLQWQNNVLNALAHEAERPVRSGLVGVAAALAQVEQAASPPFLQFLTAAANETQNPAARELCFLLLLEMTDTVGLHWKEHIPSLLQLFTHVLNNPNESTAVHKAAVQAIGQLMAFWADEPEIESMAPLLPMLLQVAGRSVSGANNATIDDDFLSTVLDVLYELAYSPAPCLLQYMPITVEFSLQCLVTQQLELRVRDAAALVIATTAEAKPKPFGRHEALLGAVLDALFQLVQNSNDSAAGALFESNPAWKADLDDANNEDLDDGEGGLDSPTETSMAQGTLDMIACEVPKKFVWPACLKRCLERLASSDGSARKAGIACLGVIAEGCTEPLTAALPDVMPRVFAAAQDPEPQVRECACFCLGQISEHCQPDILHYSPQILPIVFGLLDDNNVAVQATSCYVLEMFCERLEPEAVRPVLDSLVRKLAHMLEVTNKRSVQEMAVAALAATAVAAEEEFTPYVQGVASLMEKLIQLQDPNLYSLRGRALECMGHMAIAVGRDTFRPYFEATMRSALEGLTLNPDTSTDLQEFAYAVFANLAKVMKDEFVPALPELVPHLLKVIEMDEGQIEQADPEEGKDGGLAIGLDDSDDEGDENDGQYVLHVRTALLEVKKGAITALGEMAAHTGTNFCPHLEQCMQVLQKAANNWHPLIKTEAADALTSMIMPSIAAYHNGDLQWTKADAVGASAASPLSPHTAALAQAVLTEELALMKDEEKSTVGKACEAVQTVIELCGPHSLSPVLNDALSNTFDLLSRSAPCQIADEMYGEGPVGDDDDEDHDAFMQAACDLVGAYCRVMGSHFAQYVPQFLPCICEFAKPSRPASDRSMAVGCLSEIAQEINSPTTLADHWQTVFLPAILNGLKDEDFNVRRNSAFCAGLCCENLAKAKQQQTQPPLSVDVVNDYPTILQLLGQNFGLEDPSGGANDGFLACVDNSAAAVARMIMASPEHVPLEQVFPVFLRALPLNVDMTENTTVYQCLTGLLQMNHPQALAQREEIRRILTEATHESSKVDAETKGMLLQALQGLQQ